MYTSKLGNNTTLDAGNYKVELPTDTAKPELKFYRHGNLVATVPVQVKTLNSKPEGTEVDYDRKNGTEYITEVRPRNSEKGYMIVDSMTSKSGA